uniref:CPBP family intramembrane glutamic endopeptidase n=1 Tax=Nonomuraea pusilla TaxID=46177 RepID=UPI0009E6C3B8|nr:CPBP family intramembrane glutamic endopeptidase [Nonomuraea pusilla]
MVSEGRLAGERRVWAFFGLVFLLGVPFWVAGASGGKLPLLPMDLPVAALMFPSPLIAAVIMARWREGRGAAGGLLRRSLAPRGLREPRALLASLLTSPAVSLAASGLVALAGVPVPGEHGALAAALPLLAVYLVAAFCEEAGWMGYAVEPLRARRGALAAGLVIGVVWALWHLVPLFQAGRSPAWIAWWFVATVAIRVVMVCLYERAGGSVPSAVAVHATLNTVQSLLPGYTTQVVLMATQAVLTALLAVALLLTAPRGARA